MTTEIRQLESTDTEVVREVFDGLSAESRYLRFHQFTPQLTDSMVERLTDVDGEDHLAIAAFVDGEPAGIARIVREQGRIGEVAVEVADAHAGHGLGTALINEIIEQASEAGYCDASVYVKEDNRGARALFEKFGVHFRRGMDSLSGLLVVDETCSVAANGGSN